MENSVAIKRDPGCGPVETRPSHSAVLIPNLPLRCSLKLKMSASSYPGFAETQFPGVGSSHPPRRYIYSHRYPLSQPPEGIAAETAAATAASIIGAGPGPEGLFWYSPCSENMRSSQLYKHLY